MPYRQVPEDEWQLVMQKIERLEKLVKQLRQDQRTKVPIYQSNNLPADAVEGQVAIIFTP